MIDKFIPTKLLIPFLKLAFKKVAPNKEIEHKLASIADILKGSITKKYWYHMDLLIGDLMNEYGTHKPEDFESFYDEVMIIFSEEDTIFSDELKNALIRLMPHPTVIRNMEGGHLALLINPEEYTNKITSFISERN